MKKIKQVGQLKHLVKIIDNKKRKGIAIEILTYTDQWEKANTGRISGGKIPGRVIHRNVGK